MRKKKIQYGSRTHQSRYKLITLSRRWTEKHQYQHVKQRYPTSDEIQSEIFRITNFGLFLVNKFMPGMEKEE